MVSLIYNHCFITNTIKQLPNLLKSVYAIIHERMEMIANNVFSLKNEICFQEEKYFKNDPKPKKDFTVMLTKNRHKVLLLTPTFHRVVFIFQLLKK